LAGVRFNEVQMRILGRGTHDPVSRFSNTEKQTGTFQGWDEAVIVLNVIDNDQHVDDGLRR
jgi:hypothetical protein